MHDRRKVERCDTDEVMELVSHLAKFENRRVCEEKRHRVHQKRPEVVIATSGRSDPAPETKSRKDPKMRTSSFVPPMPREDTGGHPHAGPSGLELRPPPGRDAWMSDYSTDNGDDDYREGLDGVQG